MFLSSNVLPFIILGADSLLRESGVGVLDTFPHLHLGQPSFLLDESVHIHGCPRHQEDHIGQDEEGKHEDVDVASDQLELDGAVDNARVRNAEAGEAVDAEFIHQLGILVPLVLEDAAPKQHRGVG